MRGNFSKLLLWLGRSNSDGCRSPGAWWSRLSLNQPDVLDDGELELGAGAPDAVGDQLGLEAVDEALGERVVVGVADRADRGEDAVIGERLGVVDRGVLAGLNRSSQQCVCEMNLPVAGDGCDGLPPRRADRVMRLSSRRLAQRAGRSGDSRVRAGQAPGSAVFRRSLSGTRRALRRGFSSGGSSWDGCSGRPRRRRGHLRCAW
jgi:hypothetical protein